jgi:hypothetical protein
MAMANNTWESSMIIFSTTLGLFKEDTAEACLMRKHIMHCSHEGHNPSIFGARHCTQKMPLSEVTIIRRQLKQNRERQSTLQEV